MYKNFPNRRSDSQAQRILEMIEGGELNVGDRLPGQRELAAKLNIGRSTVREAIRSLEAYGFLETRMGLGTYVVNSAPNPIENSMIAWLAANKDMVFKVFEVREALESKAAELSAINARPDDIKLMEETLIEMERAIEENNHTCVTELDERFHDIIGQSAGNTLLYQMIENICSVLYEARGAVLSMPGRAIRSLNEHWSIYEAIKATDPNKANQAMIQHIKNAIHDIQ